MRMATMVLYNANKDQGRLNMCAILSILGNGLRCDIVQKIPTFFLHYRTLPAFPVLLRGFDWAKPGRARSCRLQQLREVKRKGGWGWWGESWRRCMRKSAEVM